ncbi:MAG: hypothetical protein UU73_C0003G0297 [Candidatus Daviesbacteria bacterium GW2011_GWA1_41_61]|uniref:EamA domain-containing protein n=1 Tax=Candidatus Daviesbacteria bacterium GW2011_GWA2_40_9 TaxID=1618424 RepID=A0A0G0U684_9BACT|nr:MAG: hypothetical protein UU26_C0018G0018 [Candidatus Daviesbacteria bacterium GW2011_GWC1_40_9]KKR82691.1 MAG: hypothetical protein UU29_C0010G0037 [Candidatus Daviesbacteria bacterium GW2011_GWA2_40_9]KKR93353.1 MAG: hypothetical protein UU44_C0002G0014 [Candidatus Daviesbacteria bacterium GW2011_GWB1_41_15]KKS15098.1 MAG: hypothetical protein UU73_C0003G0297 [Candidatus Daviesbacteria bacterium GW2011_GWA1_41_61]
MWLIFAILTAILWGVSIALLKRSYTSLTPIMGVLIGAVCGLVTLLPFGLINQGKLVFWPVIPVATVAAATYVFYYYVLEKDKAALIATVQSTYALFTVILAITFLRESITLPAQIGIALIIAGLLFLSIGNPKKIRNIKPGAWLWWGLLAAVLAGSGDFLAKTMVSGFNSYTYMIAFVVGQVIVALVLLLFDRKHLMPLKANRDTFYLIASELTLFIGYLLFYLAFKDGLASIVTPITGAYGVVTLFLALVWLKEKVTKFQILGAIITISGVILVGSV